MLGMRIFLMFVCTVLLLFALVTLGYSEWYDVFACPVKCAQQDLIGNYGGTQGAWSTAMIVLLLLSQPSVVLTLTNWGVRFSRDVRFKYMQRVDDLLRPNSPPNALISQLYSSYTYLVTHVWWLFSSIIFGAMTTIV